MTKRKLNKLLNRCKVYVATIDVVRDNNMCIVDVRHKGKLVADHLWIRKGKFAEKLTAGISISFEGIAHTYKDKKGIRKLGLSSCHNFIEMVDKYMEQMEFEKENFKRRNYK